MTSLKEIKTRISSVKSTRQITSAMKMVSSAKLHHAQMRIDSMLPYQAKLNQILSSFLESAEAHQQSVYEIERPIKRVAIVPVSSNTSLCGSFNSNVVKAVDKVISQYQDQIGEGNVLLFPIGRKIEEAALKKGYHVQGSYQEMAASPSFSLVMPLAQKLTSMFLRGEVDRVELVYYHFLSTGVQKLTQSTFLPISLNPVPVETPLGNNDYIIEPSREELLTDLIPKVLNQQLFTVLADSCASEHAARMMAMQTATDNANDLIQELTKDYNKGRQQAITNELLDIVGGSFS